jgi:hypothetical protein
MRKQFLKTALMAVAGVGLLAGSALAAPIVGGLSMAGTWTPVDSRGIATTILSATGINFGGYVEEVGDDSFQVTSKTGSFKSLPPTSLGNIYNFQFDLPQSFSEIGTLWTVGDYSFEMTFLSFTKDSDEGNNDIHIYGKGRISAAGFDKTPGVWNFTGQGANDANFSWSASVASVSPAPVPEPATTMLFALGAVGFAGIARRRVSKK